MNTMNYRRWRSVAAAIIVVATIAAFIYFFRHNPGVSQQLRNISPRLLVPLLLLHLITVGALAMVTAATVRLCKHRLPTQESLLLTAYSSIVNFFGPLQSGPAFRALYLKQKHGLQLRRYTTATFVYYLFYALFSGLFLLSGVLKWWLVIILLSGLASAVVLHRHPAFKDRLRDLDLHAWYYLALATFLQVGLYAVIYFIELRSLVPTVHFSQAIIYAGAANLALFVSFTPGAIGFRESFLVFSEGLHHISASTIVAANIIDRAVYILMLGLMALFIFGTHAKRRLELPKKVDL